ncbi:hypothetical protein BN8_00246 [Fibrisoma limi BUZ 3]|uniref:Uncharacterized protein n=1 Tax=Fibrisoma limi BUZ 3 TaxID=1185876 RepID=I2GBQ4_9BACT|nr:hypothetical protein BN8_00246 [Fibrisoma limi BUZ 3]
MIPDEKCISIGRALMSPAFLLIGYWILRNSTAY